MNDSFDLINDNTTIKTIRSIYDSMFYSNSKNKIPVFIVHQNIRSMRQNFDLLLCNIEGFVNLPDFIFLSEIWIYSCEKEDYKIPNYEFYANTNDSYSAGGVGVFVRDSYLRDDECKVDSYSLNSADIIKISCVICKENFIIICVYRVQYMPLQLFLEEFTAFLSNEKAANLIILGDFNVDILSCNPAVDIYGCLMAEHGLISFINEPTRPISNTCLDHVFGRFMKMATNLCAGVNFDLQITDHCLTGIVLNILNNKKSVDTAPRKVTKINYRQLNDNLLRESWEDIYTVRNASQAYDLFLKTLTNHIDISSFSIEQRKSEIKLKPWMNKSLLKKIKLKHKLRNKCCKHPLNPVLKNRYNHMCQKINNEIKVCRDSYYQNRISNSQGNLKKE